MLSLEDLFCSVDDFCQKFEPSWQNQLLSNGLSHRNRQRSLCLSEIMSILIAFHQSSGAQFQSLLHRKGAFPVALRLSRFGQLWTVYRVDT